MARKIRDVLRPSAAGLSKRQIAASLGIGPTAAGACLHRPREAGVGWPLPDDLGRRTGKPPLSGLDDHCQELAVAAGLAGDPPRVVPQGRDLQLVWEEYRAAHPDGYGRSWSAISIGPGKARCRRRCGRLQRAAVPVDKPILTRLDPSGSRSLPSQPKLEARRLTGMNSRKAGGGQCASSSLR